jgi:catechol-2,3-dioxygenase
MASELVAGLRSVALNVPDLIAAETFYTEVWRLKVVARTNAIYLAGSGSDAYLLSLHQGGDTPEIRKITLRARSEQALDAIVAATQHAGGASSKLSTAMLHKLMDKRAKIRRFV